MQEYRNKSCAQCGEEFTENDDIAICPDCGTPIHRACWNGRCPNEAKHNTGFDWDKAQAAEAYKKIADAAVPDKNTCAICRNPSDNDMIYCPDCGTAMHRSCYAAKGSCPNEHNHGRKTPEFSFTGEDTFESGRIIQINSFSDIIKGIKSQPIKDSVTGEELSCHGVTQKELIAFLGEQYLSTPRYFMTFLRMANSNKKTSLNFFAGLLMPYYQFYQRMIGPAVILLILNFILGLPASIYQVKIALDTSAATSIASGSLDSLMTAFSFIGLVIQVLTAFFNDYIYMRWSVNRILGLREKYKTCSESEYYAALGKAGAPKWSYTLIGIALSFVFTMIVFHFLF